MQGNGEGWCRILCCLSSFQLEFWLLSSPAGILAPLLSPAPIPGPQPCPPPVVTMSWRGRDFWQGWGDLPWLCLQLGPGRALRDIPQPHSQSQLLAGLWRLAVLSVPVPVTPSVHRSLFPVFSPPSLCWICRSGLGTWAVTPPPLTSSSPSLTTCTPTMGLRTPSSSPSASAPPQIPSPGRREPQESQESFPYPIPQQGSLHAGSQCGFRGSLGWFGGSGAVPQTYRQLLWTLAPPIMVLGSQCHGIL